MTAPDRVPRLGQWLLAALTDPGRRERNAALVLLGYALLWTLYAVIAKASQDIHYDMAEQVALSRELALGYSKHPPLAAVVTRIWFAVFPLADWAYYLLAMATAMLALWIAWRLAARFLDSEKRVAALALLMLVPFFNFHALKYNQNTILLPVWAATTLFFLRSFETRRLLDAALAGAFAALAMYGKYWSVMLLGGLGVAALCDARRAVYFRSAAPWVTIAVGGLLLAPHVAWMAANDAAPLSYALDLHGSRPFAFVVRSVLTYLAGAIGYVALSVVVAFVATRPSRAAAADMLWPAVPERRLAVTAFWGPLLLPVLMAFLISFEPTALWSMPAWTLLPVLLLSSPLLTLQRHAAAWLVTGVAVFPLVAIAVAPAVAVATLRAGIAPGAAHASLLAPAVAQLWRETTERPLRQFAGWADLGYGVAFYLPSRPSVVNALDGIPPPDLDRQIAGNGIALVCPAQSAGCLHAAARLGERGPAGKRREVEVARRFLGVSGAPARYVIITIPPRAS